MYRLWIIFAQTATVCLAVLFVVSTLKPEWLPARAFGPGGEPPRIALLQQAAQPAAGAHRAESYNDAVLKAAPAVVNIFTSKEVRVSRNPMLNDPLFRRFFGDQPGGEDTQRSASLGSGVIVSPAGYILTNHHVVEAADEIEVATPDGKKLLAKVVGNDPETDLAVLRVEAGNLPAITFGSSDNLRVGDIVLAIGNPFGVGQTVTSGIVSAVGRSLGLSAFENFIQTDAPINPGNSGGALIDVRGHLIGINTAIYSRAPGGASLGIGFATPVSTAKMVLEQIIKSGTVTRGWIGVELQPVTPALAESFKLGTAQGAIINGVLSGGPADKGGAKPGDVLVSIDGRSVADPQGVLNAVTALAPGTPAKVKVKRKGQDVELAITVGRRPKPQPRPE
jgi:serine protease DegQ